MTPTSSNDPNDSSQTASHASAPLSDDSMAAVHHPAEPFGQLPLFWFVTQSRYDDGSLHGRVAEQHPMAATAAAAGLHDRSPVDLYKARAQEFLASFGGRFGPPSGNNTNNGDDGILDGAFGNGTPVGGVNDILKGILVHDVLDGTLVQEILDSAFDSDMHEAGSD